MVRDLELDLQTTVIEMDLDAVVSVVSATYPLVLDIEVTADPVVLEVLQGQPGNKGLNWRGDWDVAEVYAVDDAVGYGGGAYVCVAGTLAGDSPAGTPAKWDLVAAKGDKGDTGASGGGASGSLAAAFFLGG